MTSVTIVQLPKTAALNAGVGGWITLIATSIIFGIAAMIIASLNNMFQGEVLFDYSSKIVGKFVSYFLGVFYLLYFLITSAYLCASMGNVLTQNFFLKTPAWAILFIGMPFYGYAAYKGVTNIARIFEIYGVIFIVTAVTIHVIMLLQGRIENILPLYIPEDTGQYFSAMKNVIIPFLGIEVLVFIPFTKANGKKAPRTAFLTILGIGLFYALVVESSIMMLGMNEIVHNNDPLIAAIRQVDLPFINFLERMDILYLTVGFMGIFAGKSIVYLAIVEFACRLFPRVKRAVIVIAAGAAIFLLDLLILDINSFGAFFNVFAIFIGTAAAIVIPVLLFVLAKVKKRAGKIN